MVDIQSRGAARVISRALMYFILLVAALLAVLPFYWTVVGSLMTPVELYSQIPHLWPAHPDFTSYTRIFELVPMGRYFFNTALTSRIERAEVSQGLSTISSFRLGRERYVRAASEGGPAKTAT